MRQGSGRPPSTRKGLPSTRSCSGRGRGRDLLFLAELEQDPPCPVLDAGRWSCHRRLEPQTTLAATVAGARHVPVSWTVLVECVSRKRDALRDSADGMRLEGRDPRKHGWQPWRGARLRQGQDGSTGKFLADTRAPSSLRRARCGRTPPKSYATACGLDSAHAPLLAKTHPINCPSPR